MRRQIAVVGGGLSGYSAAIGFALQGFDTVLLAPPPGEDRRTTALIGDTVDFMKRIEVWQGLVDRVQPLKTMRIIDDTRRLLRAPTVEFRASEIDRPDFGVNSSNRDIMAALRDTAAKLGDRLHILERQLVSLAVTAERASLRLDDGSEILADLVVGADGRRSVVREHAGIALRRWSYPQSAIVLNFGHERAHQAMSTEFHTRTGPFTQVPLPGSRSSLVWVEEPKVAVLAADLPAERLSAMVEERLHSILGKVEVEPGVQVFPLSGGSAERLTAPRVALIGEAAHLFPPIGAQGLNLGLRDAAAIIEAASAHRDDPGGPSAIGRYEAARRADISSRSIGVDLLNRSLLLDFLPVQMARSVGLGALANVTPLRRFAMREGISPGSGLRRIRDRMTERRGPRPRS